jgi:hypothetical protein
MKLARALLLVSLTAWAVSLATFAAAPIPSVSVRLVTYSNVVVEEVSPTSVTVSHSRGIASFNRKKLTIEEQQGLGLIEKPITPAPKAEAPRRRWASNAISVSTNDYPLSIAKTIELAARLQSINAGDLRPFVERLSASGRAALITPIIIYVMLCVCFGLICSKTGKPAPVLVWVPFFQIFALYRAAKMSPAWFGLLLFDLIARLAFFSFLYNRPVPVQVLVGFGFLFVVLTILHAIIWIVWCFKICLARGKSVLLGLCLLLPGLNLLALLYLAFSDAPDLKIKLA